MGKVIQLQRPLLFLHTTLSLVLLERCCFLAAHFSHPPLTALRYDILRRIHMQKTSFFGEES